MTILFHSAMIIAGCGLIALALLRDIAARTIPNEICMAVAGLAVLAHLTAGDWMFALPAAAAVFLLCYALWTRGLIGGGDVKLLAAAALLVPPGAIPALILATALAGGVLGLAYLGLARLVRRPRGPRPAPLLARIIRAERWRMSRGAPLPYACAIAAGTFTVLLNG